MRERRPSLIWCDCSIAPCLGEYMHARTRMRRSNRWLSWHSTTPSLVHAVTCREIGNRVWLRRRRPDAMLLLPPLACLQSDLIHELEGGHIIVLPAADVRCVHACWTCIYGRILQGPSSWHNQTIRQKHQRRGQSQSTKASIVIYLFCTLLASSHRADILVN